MKNAIADCLIVLGLIPLVGYLAMIVYIAFKCWGGCEF